MKKTQIIVVNGGADDNDEWESSISALGYETVAAENLEEAADISKSEGAWVAAVDTAKPGKNFFDSLRLLKKSADDLLLIVAADRDCLDRVIEELRTVAEDFLEKPVRLELLEMALRRASEKAVLKKKLAKIRKQQEIAEKTRDRTTEIAETEKLIAVRQVVDKMSSFVARIAKDVQGGMRYFKQMPYFVSIHDSDCKVVALNPIYKSHFGNKIGKNSWEIYLGDAASRRGCPVGRTLDTGNVQRSHAVVRYLSGRHVPVIVHTSPIYDNEGEVELVLEVSAGTKELESFEIELKSTQQRFEQLFNEVPCYVAVLDHKFRVTALNRKCKEDFGDFTGKGFFDVFRQAQTPYFTCPITRTLEDGEPHHSEMILTAPNGDIQNFLAWTSPVKTAAGKLLQVNVIFMDVTELRELQDNLSTLGLMIGSVSHGIKGILTGMDAGIYLIDSGFYKDMPARVEEGLDVVKLMADRMRKVVYDILYYTKERELETTRVNVLKFAGEVAANMDIKIRGANIEFVCDFEPFLGDFEIDVSLVRAAFVNILENAMEACIADKADKSHQILFRVSAEGDCVVFDFIDNGPGLSEEEIKKIFAMFYSSKGSRGTGLGLFVTEKTIRKHGGTVTLESSPGEGAHFQIRLPRAPVAAEVEEKNGEAPDGFENLRPAR